MGGRKRSSSAASASSFCARSARSAAENCAAASACRYVKKDVRVGRGSSKLTRFWMPLRMSPTIAPSAIFSPSLVVLSAA
jgi:hypothetical protein